jgi:alkylated DNA repair dioxygenase AlkB
MTAPVTYIPGFVLDPDPIFDFLWNDLDWEHRETRDDSVDPPTVSKVPRREYWTNSLDRPYTYGRGIGMRTYYPRVTHPAIESCNSKLEEMLGFRYEGCFLNGYENEWDALGWHADADPGIDHSRPIAVVTVGAGRAIQFKGQGADTKEEVFLESGSLLLMHPGMQSTHLHRIPKVGRKTDPRISLTFRGLIA